MRDLRIYQGLDRPGVVELVLVTQVLVLWPLFHYLPFWIRIVCLSVIAARLLMVRMGWKVPGRIISGILGLAAATAIYINFGTLGGRDAGVSLIVVMYCLKLFEMRWYRDAALVLYLSFFIMVANFLFSQTLLMAVYMILCILVVIIAMQALNRIDGGVKFKELFRHSLRMFLQAIPLLLVLFIFFPRLSQPLWQMPSSLTGTTGISDSMTPGDIASLVNFDEPAFRVEFFGDVPPSSELYWRGLVFSDFDGLTWSRSEIILQSESNVRFSGKKYQYQILLEPHRRNWLYALEMPESMVDVARTTTDNTWQRRFPLRSRLAYQLTSYAGSSFGYQLSENERSQNLKLPGDGNPQARLWAQKTLQDRQGNKVEYINTVLRKINREPYIYTLNPGVMAVDMVDDFWFNKRKGFCEHYAGAFVFLMRAGGIPARVVTGYQGGEMNPYADYMLVRQANAHAWTEVWLSGQGWVRIDPTAAIHPSRVEVDLSQAWLQREPIFNDIVPANWRQYSPDMIDKIQLLWDSLNNNWQSMVIDFDAGSQYELLSSLGLPDMDMQDLVNFLLVLSLVVMAITTALLLRKTSHLDKTAQCYLKLCRKLTVMGCYRLNTEGPVDYLHRVMALHPHLASQLKPILEIYVSLRYRESTQSRKLMHQLIKRVNKLKVKKSSAKAVQLEAN